MKQNKRAVSLIVLVITIIVIIILAAAVILTINNNNPMDNANKARYMSDRANVQNALSTAVGKIAADKMCSVIIPAQADIVSGIGYTLTGANDGITAGKIGWDTLATVSGDEEATTTLGMKMPNYGNGTRWSINSNGDISVEVAGVIYGSGGTTQKTLQPGEEAVGDTNYTVDGKTAVIPNGFYVSKVPEEQSIAGGLVIVAPDNEVEAKRSQFVWVPVDKVSDMFSGTSGNFAGELTSYNKDGIIIEYHEPAILTDAVNGDTNANIATMKEILNLPLDKELTTGSDLQKFMQADMGAMYESIQKNKGFYIGRYETGDLSKDQVVSNVGNRDIAGKTWYIMYAKQKRYGEQLAKGVKSSMIYGSQWDAVMRWFAEDKNIAGYITNATGQGFFGGDSPMPTGQYPVKNIYDMAGNIFDWTAEAYSTYGRTLRGSSYSYATEHQYAGYRNNWYPTNIDGSWR